MEKRGPKNTEAIKDTGSNKVKDHVREACIRKRTERLINEVKDAIGDLTKYNSEVCKYLKRLNDDKAAKNIKENIVSIAINMEITQEYIRKVEYNKWKNKVVEIKQVINQIKEITESIEINVDTKMINNVREQLKKINEDLLGPEVYDSYLKELLKSDLNALIPQERRNEGGFGGEQPKGQEKVQTFQDQPLGVTTSKPQENDLSRKKQSESQKELQRREELKRKLEQLKKDYCLQKRQHGVQKESDWYYQYADCQKSQSQGSQLKQSNKVIGRLGKYQLIGKPLGAGSFGKVFHGRHVDTGEEVAIKVLHDNINQGGINDFCDEIWNMANLEHKNIMPLLGFGRKGNVLYFVMEYMPGGTLDGKRLSRMEDVVEKMGQICQGVEHIHGKEIIHQDLKPENILLGENDEAVIGDLGLAARVDTEETKGGWGTSLYKAYEQWEKLGKRNAGACYQSDVYALALIAFELATGKKLINCMRDDNTIKQSLEDKTKKWENEYRWEDNQRPKRKWVKNKQYKWLHKRTGEWLRAKYDDEFLLALAPALERDSTRRTKDAMSLLKELKKGLRLSRIKESIRWISDKNVKQYYIGIKQQKERTEVYKMLKPELQAALVRRLEYEDVKNLYMDIVRQGMHMELYKMLKPGQQEELVRGLGDEDVKKIYMGINEQEKRLELFEMLGLSQQKASVKWLELAETQKLVQKYSGRESFKELFEILKQHQEKLEKPQKNLESRQKVGQRLNQL